MAQRIRRSLYCVVAVLIAAAAVPRAWAETDTVRIFAAGSLRGVLGQLARTSSTTLQVQLQTTFGGSGSLRERIEKGETPDLFLSADLASPRQLEAQGRTRLPVIAFARNRMCILSRRSAGVTADNLVERMLMKGVRVWTATPIVDPSGDYAWSMFDRIDRSHPGAGALLKQKAQAVMDVKATALLPGQSATAALFATGRIDMAVTYCSATRALGSERPDLTSLAVPAGLDPHPLYGLAILSDTRAAMRVALFLLSHQGQAIMDAQGLLPLLDEPSGAP